MKSLKKAFPQDDNLRLLSQGAEEFGLSLTSEQILSFEKYLSELKDWAGRTNLLSRANDREIILKDFLDSLTVTRHLFPGAFLLDLGSGAGFPGIPLRIIRPDLRVFLSEATRKKVYFLKNIKRVLRLEGLEIHWAEETKECFGGIFDFVISRAFGSLRKFTSEGRHFLKPGGVLLAMKGKKGEEELGKSLPYIEKMGLTLAFTDRLILPFLGHSRVLIGLRKGGSSPIS